LLALRDAQPATMRGVPALVPVLEASSDPSHPSQLTALRIGRFGWKGQHASLLSFAGDAYLNELGVTNPLFPAENLSSGRFVGYPSKYDPLPEPEDNGNDIMTFADFMRATAAPSRGPITSSVHRGEQVFNQIGCAICHVPTIVTAPPGTVINAGTFTVPQILGNKIIHPYSDFLLHDIGTSDNIPIQPTSDYAYTASVMRTAPLWGLRTRNRLFHNAQSLTYEEAIRLHRRQAAPVIAKYNALSSSQRNALQDFLASL
jgi:CxxC motif-containing protein (DUF1111 family)